MPTTDAKTADLIAVAALIIAAAVIAAAAAALPAAPARVQTPPAGPEGTYCLRGVHEVGSCPAARRRFRLHFLA
jgi:hypothetical protein